MYIVKLTDYEGNFIELKFTNEREAYAFAGSILGASMVYHCENLDNATIEFLPT